MSILTDDPAKRNVNEEEELKKICYEKAHERYGKELPRQVKECLKDELVKIARYGYASYYLLAAKVAEECKRLGACHLARGTAGASFVAFLLGITETNPLPPHFYCPSCGNVAFSYWKLLDDEDPAAEDRAESGFDFVSVYQVKHKCRRCGNEYVGEGHDIPFEIFAGVHGEKRPDFVMDVPEEKVSEIMCFLGNRHEKITVNGNSMLSHLNKLERLTGVSEESIPIDGVGYQSFFSEGGCKDIPMLEEIPGYILDKFFVCSFSDIVRLLGYCHSIGVWGGTAEEIKEMSRLYDPDKTIVHREHVMMGLLCYGMDREEAYHIMEIVRKGRAARDFTEEDLRLLREKDISEEFMDAMMKIKYLFPKAHDTEYAIKIFKLMWYRVHFPEEFEAVFNTN